MIYFGIDDIGLRRLRTRGCQVATASKPDTPPEVAVQVRAVKVVIAWVYSNAKGLLVARFDVLARKCLEVKGTVVVVKLWCWAIASLREGDRIQDFLELFRAFRLYFKNLVAPKAQQQPQP